MLTIQSIEDFGHRLLAIAAKASAKVEPILQSAAKVAEFVDKKDAPVIAAVAMVAAEVNTELQALNDGQTNATDALLAMLPDALATWNQAA